MLHEIKKNLGENSNQEYLNHINLLKVIKENINDEKGRFRERLQGAEVSLFIENVFSVNSKVFNPPTDPGDLSSYVSKMIEKKNMIEKLQFKMNQRIGILNGLLSNHVASNN